MLNVGIIGCGNAGNQVCALSTKKYPDIPVFAFNCSENDMNTLPASVQNRILIGDGKGAGKNREEAKNFLQNAIMEVVADDQFKAFLGGLDIVFVVSSTGGGTGSGMSVLFTNIISMISQKYEKPVFPISVGILPTLNEALATQANTLQYLTELYELSDSPTYMMYDNEKFSKMSTVETLTKVNEKIVEDINVLRCYYNAPTTFNSIDERDAMTLVTTPGRIVVGSLMDVKEKDCDDDETLEDKLLTELKKNAHCEMQFDSIVNRTGLIANLSESMLSRFDTHVPKVQKLIGAPIEEFEHVSINSERKLPNNVFYIATGLTPVNDRITKIKDRIDEINEAQKKKQDEMELDESLLSGIQEKRVYRRPAGSANGQPEQIDISGLFDKFKGKK